jgi:hypothetical protein
VSGDDVMLQLSLEKHPDPRARKLKGIKIYFNSATFTVRAVKAPPVHEAWLTVFETDESANRIPIKVGGRVRAEHKSSARVHDKLGGWPIFVQNDEWEGSKHPEKLVNIVTWVTDGTAVGGTAWAGDGTIVNVWLDEAGHIQAEASMS